MSALQKLGKPELEFLESITNQPALFPPPLLFPFCPAPPPPPKLTEEVANEIYKRDDVDRNRVEELPEHLRHIFFDMCVNQGRGTAVKILQRACVAKGADIAIDGGMGPGTMGAIETYKPSTERVRCYRLKHYYDLVNAKPEQERFLYGWYKRAISI